MKRGIVVVAIMAFGCFLYACGSSSDSGSSSSSPTVSTIEQLPMATGPMAASSSSVSALPSIGKAAEVGKAAATGLNIISTQQSDFEHDDSMGACEVFNVVRQSVLSAAQADRILCYVQAMAALDTFEGLTDSAGNPVVIDDGSWHIFNMNFEGADEGAPSRVKMRIQKTGDAITSFTMFMCQGSGDSIAQNEYTSQTIDGSNFVMTAKGMYSDGEWTGRHQVDVTGALNASNAFTSKTVTAKDYGSAIGGANLNWQESTLAQLPGAFALSGYRYGNYTDPEGGTGTSQEAAYSKGQMLGDSVVDRTIANLAMGDGAVKVDGAYTSSRWGAYDPDPSVDAWLGDGAEVLTPASDSAYYADANAGTLPTVGAQPSIEFTADQTWDCTDGGIAYATLPVVSLPAIESACSQYGGMGGDSWINCYEQIGQYQQH